MQRIKAQNAALAEAPVLRLTWLTAAINRSSDAPPLTREQLESFRCFKLEEDDNTGNIDLDAETAAAMMSLQRENKCPPHLLGAWPWVEKGLKEGIHPPERRALISDCKRVAIINPSITQHTITGKIVGVDNIVGYITVRDIDRQLLSYRVIVPRKGTPGWIARDLTLKVAD